MPYIFKIIFFITIIIIFSSNCLIFFQFQKTIFEKEPVPQVIKNKPNIVSFDAEIKIDPTEVSAQKGNIILIIMDSVRADHLPDYGYHRKMTPFLSSIQNDLIRIPIVYSQANGTEKSIPAILFSRYPTIQTRPNDWGLLSHLHKMGYSGAIFSSMDLRWGNMNRTFTHPLIKKMFHAGDMHKKYHIWGFNKKAAFNYGIDDGHTVSEMKKFIKNLPRPFFLVLHYHTTHYSYEVPEKYIVFQPIPKLPYRNAPPWSPMLNAYHNAIYRVDDAIRETFDIFREENILDNSSIAITSDHGEAFDEHPKSYYHQTSLYDSQVKVPLYFYIGKNLEAARPFIQKGKDRIVGSVDIMPTLFKANGLNLPEKFQGVPVWGTSTKSHENFVSFAFRPMQAVRVQNWKLIKNYQNKSTLLFDLDKDPDEKINLATIHPDIVKKMQKLLFSYK